MKKQIAILGSTGSIGTQALQVIEEQSDQYEAYVLTANNRVEELIAQARKFKPEAVVIANETKYAQLKEALADLPIKVYAGTDAICQIVEDSEIDIVLTAMVGYAGLKPTMNAIRARKPIALANKETLVVAGELINDMATPIRYTYITGRFRTFSRFPMFSGGTRQSDREGDPYGIRWSIPQLHNGTTGYGNQSPSPETS